MHNLTIKNIYAKIKLRKIGEMSMKLKIKAISILLIGIATSIALPKVITSLTSQNLKQ